MPDEKVFVVKSMPVAGLVEDGSVTKLHFECEGGGTIILKFSIPQIERFAVRAHQLSVRDRIQKATTAGHLELHGVGAAAVTAQPGIGGRSVMLVIRTPQQEMIPYSLSLEQAQALHDELREAIAKAQGDAGQTRQ
jgi:hypothetical protein